MASPLSTGLAGSQEQLRKRWEEKSSAQHGPTVSSSIESCSSLATTQAQTAQAWSFANNISATPELGQASAGGGHEGDEDLDRFLERKASILIRSRPFTASDLDDVVQVLRLEWWRATRRFDARRGSFYSFRKTIVERAAGRLLAAARARSRYSPTTISFSAPMISGNSISARDLSQDCRHTVGHFTSKNCEERRDLESDIASVLATLSRPQQSLCHLLMHHSVTEVSQMTGVPRSTLSARLAKIRRRFESRRMSDYL